MPLLPGKKNMGKNIKTEMAAGKPQKQSIAIAYAMAKKHKKMAMGGDPKDPVEDSRLQSNALECEHCGGPHSNEEHEMDRHDSEGEPMMAEGGQITDNWQSSSSANHQTHDGMVDPQDEYAPEHQGDDVKSNDSAMSESARKLNQHGAHEMGPDGVWMAEGGQITDNEQDSSHEMDMVGRIMKQRQQMYSEGGRIANETDVDSAKKMPAQYDDLVLRDDLESSSDGANNGDMLGNEQEDEDRKDIVSRIMKSRAKKDKLPNPR